MTRRRCQYIVKPASLIWNNTIPDSIYRKYDQLLVRAWEETGAQYAYVSLSNQELGKLWGLSERGVRAALTDMHRVGLIETEQIGRTGRLIHLKIAWRGTGKDSAPETNQPEERAVRPDAYDAVPAAATQAPAQYRIGQSDADVPAGGAKKSYMPEGGRKSAYLGVNTNSVVVGTTLSLESETTTTNNSEGGRKSAYLGRRFAPDERERILDALWELGIWENAWEELLALPHISAEYVEGWLQHKRIEGARLTGGFYMVQMRAGRESPYVAQPPPRLVTRADFSDAEWQRILPENREKILCGELHG